MPSIAPKFPLDESVPLPGVPLPVLLLLAGWLAPILAWAQGWLWQQVLARNRDHPLVHLEQSGYRPDGVVARCADYYHQAGRGAPPTSSVEQLVRCELVRVWAESCSDPALERLLTNDLVARWYVGLALWQPAPDHSTLNRFHAWLCAHQPRALFEDVLAFLDRVDPERSGATQWLDTFALGSPAAPTGVVELLLGLLAQLLEEWRALAPPEALAALPPLDEAAWRQPTPARTPESRARRLRRRGAVTPVHSGRTSLVQSCGSPALYVIGDLTERR